MEARTRERTMALFDILSRFLINKLHIVNITNVTIIPQNAYFSY